MTNGAALHKIFWYREKNREEEEYVSRMGREKGSLAERPFAGPMRKVASELFC